MKFNIQRLIDKFGFEIVNNPTNKNAKDLEIEISKALPILLGVQPHINVTNVALTAGHDDQITFTETEKLWEWVTGDESQDWTPSLVIFTNDFDKTSEVYKTLISVLQNNNVLVLSVDLQLKEFYVIWDPYIIAKTNFKERVHGVLMSIFGVGVLFQGQSGIGKSELALDLIKNNHIFIADDIIDIFHHGDKLIGKAPSATRPFLEVRGVGIINIVKSYGIQKTRKNNEIDLIIQLVSMDKYDNSERLNIERKYFEFEFGFKIQKITIPIAPGRSVATIVESAVINYREVEENGYIPLNDMEERIKIKGESE